jgi:RecA/RadA recombinase
MARRRIEQVEEVEENVTPIRNSRLKAMEALAKSHSAFKPAGQVLTPVRVVPTIFAQYDHALRVGGHPIERVVTVHGPSNHGKTAFVLGLGRSFLQRDHFFKLVDAEFTTPTAWLKTMLGPELFQDERTHHPGFVATRPQNYEETVDDIRSFVTKIEKERDEGNLDPDTTAIIAIDSIRKLVPKKFFEKVVGEGSKKGAKANGIDGFGGRGAQIKAALNAAWLDELVPLLYKTRTGIVFIARESEDTEADANDKKWGNDYKVTGGKSIIFDSSIVARVERDRWVYGPGPEGEKKPVYGEKHRITVKKTKIAGKTDKVQVGFFHTSNGVWTPEGFDTARDLVELGIRFGVLKQAKSWIQFGNRKWNGEHAVVKALYENRIVLRDLESEVRAAFDSTSPLEEDD